MAGNFQNTCNTAPAQYDFILISPFKLTLQSFLRQSISKPSSIWYISHVLRKIDTSKIQTCWQGDSCCHPAACCRNTDEMVNGQGGLPVVGSPEMPMMCIVLGSPSVTAMILRAAPLSAEISAQSMLPLSGSCKEVVCQQDGPCALKPFPRSCT